MSYLKLVSVVALTSFFFPSCGELDAVLSPGGVYQVSAKIDSVPLETNSIITGKDAIHPYFINSVANDPDVTGLTVFLQTPGGVMAGEKVRYTLRENGRQEARERLVPVSRLDRDLPAFPLPQDLALGRYTLVFQVVGQNEILYRTDKPVYFLGDAELDLEDIQCYLPDEGIHLIPPGTTVMLETAVWADERLDPYIIWYNGKTVIGESLVGPAGGGSSGISRGIHRLLWQIPPAEGFQLIRAEVFPFQSARTATAGKFKEISLPVSSKNESAAAEEVTHWYRFQGDLQNFTEPDQAIVPGTATSPHWRPHGGIYGIALGPSDVYTFPECLFRGEERGRMTLRFAPLAEGSLFSASFYLGHDKSKTLDMNLSIAGQDMVLIFGAENQTRRMRIPLYPVTADFVTAFIDFSYEPGSFTVNLQLGEEAAAETITLSDSINGEGAFSLGGNPPEQAGILSPGTDIAVILDEVTVSRHNPP